MRNAKLLVLVPKVAERPLTLYLTVNEKSMGCILGQQNETGKKEHAIYYLSNRFTDYEVRYTMVEKMCCALVWAARRLRQYILSHPTILIKFFLEKPSLSGRIDRWQV